MTQSIRLPEIMISSRLPQDVARRQAEHPLLSALWVGSAGYFPRARGHLTVRAAEEVNFYLMMYCLEGCGWFQSGERRWRVERGDLVVALRGLAHGYGADDDDPWTIQFAHFDGNDVPALLQLASIVPDKQVVSVGQQSSLFAAFNEMLAILQSGYSLHHLMIASAALRSILSRVALINTYTLTAASQGLDVQQVIQAMLEQITKRRSLDDFARSANMSQSAFAHGFRAKTGYSPIDYFLRLKIQKACELLETSDMQIGEISRYLGYEDQYYFSRLFKKFMGVSPSQYQREL